MLVSKCCKDVLTVAGHTTHYYVCEACGKPTDAQPSFTWSSANVDPRQSGEVKTIFDLA
jgi:hypothetical protein